MEHNLYYLSSIQCNIFDVFFKKNAFSDVFRKEICHVTLVIRRSDVIFTPLEKGVFTMNIAEIDKNYAAVPIEGFDFVFYDALTDIPEMLEGLPFGKKDQQYCRIPQTMLDEVSPGVRSLAWNTSGVTLRFVSDTPAVTVKYTPEHTLDIDNVPLTTRAGLDIYRRKTGGSFIHCGTLRYNGNTSMQLKNALLCKNSDGTTYEYLINFPLYGGVGNFALGIVKGSRFEKAPAHKVPHPVLFYGSSITQGSAASRPGNHYCARLCRAVDAEEINFGFAGNARGEQNIATLTASLELSAYILDYDHNAPTLEHLQNTHSAFFRTIRKIQPQLPVIMLNRPANWESGDTAGLRARRDVIYRTYLDAVNAGDKNVRFIEGECLFEGLDRSDCTSDLTHPNDVGFERMYRKILPVLQEVLKIK